ncbi:MAG: exodeoxyribonuclease VII large subunit [Oscillospiraceae bacterium]|nr:exodeoxyribonuclease VII large subunit [Oscillospiraceae bacterium]
MQQRPLTVSQCNRYIKSLLDENALLSDITLKGEISNFKGQYASGHFYFTLKDQECSIRAVMFRGYASKVRFTPENGMTVLVRGQVSVYDRDGVYQIYCKEMQPDGVGELALAFEQLKRRLEAEKLFDPARKKPIPRYPRVIGVVTAKTGAALQDILNILRRRYPAAVVLVRSALVQGESAAEDIAAGIRQLDALGLCDVMIVGRGGGSLEDLWCFNDERVARAVYACRTPVISAVGHEVDFTICDFVADLRAPTPSAAAELAAPDVQEVQMRLLEMEGRIKKRLDAQINTLSARVEGYRSHKALSSPAYAIDRWAGRLESLQRAMGERMGARLEVLEHRFSGIAGRLHSLSPLMVLSRGYAIASKNGEPVTSQAQVQEGDLLELRLKDGRIKASVTEKETVFLKERSDFG